MLKVIGLTNFYRRKLKSCEKTLQDKNEEDTNVGDSSVEHDEVVLKIKMNN